MEKNKKPVLLFALTLCLFCFARLLAQPQTPLEIMKKIFQLSGKIAGFQAKIFYYRQDPDFMAETFGSFKAANVFKGKLYFKLPNHFEIIFPREDETIRLVSDDGIILRAFKEPKLKTQTSSPQEEKILSQSPFNLIFPYQFVTSYPGESFKRLPDEPVYGKNCYVFEVKSRFKGDHTIWLEPETLAVSRIRYRNSEGKTINAFYRSFVRLADGFWLYSILEVTADNQPFFYVELTPQGVKLEEAQAAPAAPAKKAPLPIYRTEKEQYVVTKDGRVVKVGARQTLITPFQLLMILALLGGFIFLLYRLFHDILTREVLDEEILVLDNESGELLPILKNLGIQAMNFSPQALTEERKIVGARRGKIQARAVIIAPGSLNRIKNYLFLLRAYIEEGGRVLLLFPYPQEMEIFPFKTEFIPYDPKILGTVFISRKAFWQGAGTNSSEIKVYHIMPEYVCLKMEDAPPSKEIVTLYKKELGIRGVLAGVFRHEQGEVMVCQFNLLPGIKKEGHGGIAGTILTNLVRYLQNRPEKKRKRSI